MKVNVKSLYGKQEVHGDTQNRSVAFIVERTMTIQKNFSNLQIVLIQNVPIKRKTDYPFKWIQLIE